MKLDAKYLAAAILEMEEKKPEPNREYKQVLGIASGNKNYFAKATLEDIADLIENLHEILSREFQTDYPEISLKSLPKSSVNIRRAI